MEEKKLTGYPLIDKPWLKYYSEEVIKAAQGITPIPEKTLYQYALECNQNGMNDVALLRKSPLNNWRISRKHYN